MENGRNGVRRDTRKACGKTRGKACGKTHGKAHGMIKKLEKAQAGSTKKWTARV